MNEEEYITANRIFRSVRGYDVSQKTIPYCCRPNTSGIVDCQKKGDCTCSKSCGFFNSGGNENDI